MKKCRIVTFANQKGGVGKTSASHALATGLTQKGYKVLAVDTDPQGNLSYTMGADTEAPGVYEMMKGTCAPHDAVQRTTQGDVICGSLMLSSADIDFNGVGREYLLAEALEPLASRYDFIVIDSPPQLGVLTINALTAANDVIVPMGADIYSIIGYSQLLETIDKVRKRCNPGLIIAGLLMTRHNNRTILGRDLKDALEEKARLLGSKIFKSFIREGVAVKEAQTNRESLYASKSKVAEDYIAFVDEYLKGCELLAS